MKHFVLFGAFAALLPLSLSAQTADEIVAASRTALKRTPSPPGPAWSSTTRTAPPPSA
jgi:hypothetical protein